MKDRNYLSAKRVPPSRPHVRKLVESLLETFVFPNVPPPPSNETAESEVEWECNILIPRISWGTKFRGAKIYVQYKFSEPERITVEIYWDSSSSQVLKGMCDTIKFNILHTVPMDNSQTLKGICATFIAKGLKYEIPGKLKEKIGPALADYVFKCGQDAQNLESKREKFADGPIPDFFSITVRKSNDAFSVGSMQHYSCQDYVLDPSAYYLSPCHTERCIIIDDKKSVANSRVFNGSQAPPDIMLETVTSTPRFLSTLITEPDTVFEATKEGVRKLTDHIKAESVENLRYISEMDLAYSGGGLGGVTVDLVKPTDSQRAAFINSVQKNQTTTIDQFETMKNTIPSIVKEVLSLLYVLKGFALENNEDLFLFDRGIDWEQLIEDPKFHGF
eukprot:Phypoly_transcript_10815.p1 GENE.Phypoly_transcript_10815~~Phypoly_transcript_10815.p1  ORF type:complete len:389 (+),score=49.99 Phypoly_transcript_10815:54-1220(+)